jgi:thiamine biosynthesis lipoprotein
VADFLGGKFEDFLIDAGGDIYTRGANRKEGYAYWAIEVEQSPGEDSPTLLTLSDMAVATSGVNRRFWLKDGVRKHHIIDPSIGSSATSDFISVTVIAPSTTAADVWAKSLFIAGKDGADALADTFHIPAVFVGADHNQYANEYAAPYIWKA